MAEQKKENIDEIKEREKGKNKKKQKKKTVDKKVKIQLWNYRKKIPCVSCGWTNAC